MDIKRIFIIISFVLFFAVGGYFIWKSFSGSAVAPGFFPSPVPADNISPEDARDDQRISDILYLSEIIDNYNFDHKGNIFITDKGQKISDEGSAIFRELKDNGYLSKALKDPLPDKYYYGYYSDAYMYALTAVLENKNSGKCEIIGDLCIYKVTKEADPFLSENYSDNTYDFKDEF